MASTIIPKRSSVPGKVPQQSDLQVGEIAVNLADKKIFSKDGSGSVITLGGEGSSGPSESSVIAYAIALG